MINPPLEMTDPSEVTTLTELLAAYATGGFPSWFSASPDVHMVCHECGDRFAAADAAMSSLRRLEGASDPADMLAVVALTCPRCAAKGTAVLGFGPAGAAEDGDVLGALGERAADPAVPRHAAPGEGFEGR